MHTYRTIFKWIYLRWIVGIKAISGSDEFKGAIFAYIGLTWDWCEILTVILLMQSARHGADVASSVVAIHHGRSNRTETFISTKAVLTSPSLITSGFRRTTNSQKSERNSPLQRFWCATLHWVSRHYPANCPKKQCAKSFVVWILPHKLV